VALSIEVNFKKYWRSRIVFRVRKYFRGTLRINSSTPRTMESKPNPGQTSAWPPIRQAAPGTDRRPPENLSAP